MPEGEGAEESQGLMSQSESSDEEPDLLWLRLRTPGRGRTGSSKKKEGKRGKIGGSGREREEK